MQTENLLVILLVMSAAFVVLVITISWIRNLYK